MNNLNGFKDIELTRKILDRTYNLKNRPSKANIMEVCGTHTMSIYKNGIDKLLPPYIQLLSGPGCPVCVTDIGFIDTAVRLAQIKGTLIAVFGDLLRVPGSQASLSDLRAEGADIRVVYSPLDCITLAQKHPNKEVVFVGIGFETTAPAIALAIKAASLKSIPNFSVLSSLKTMPDAMENLIFDEEVVVDAFICPGHVAAVIGINAFNELAKKYQVPMVVAGFEALDIVSAVYTLLQMLNTKTYSCQNLYSRVVKPEGNIKAASLLNEVFEESSSSWRGLGTLPKAGLILKSYFNHFNAFIKFNLTLPEVKEPLGCQCVDVIKGLKRPSECSLYKKRCTPSHPVGACMVSSEGACMNFYKYND